MDDKKRSQRDVEMDDFWDIDALIPPRRAAHYAHDTEAVEITLDVAGSTAPNTVAVPRRADSPEQHFIPPHNKEEMHGAPLPDEEYTPSGSLIHTVRIYRRREKYPYYEDFLRDAARLYAVKGVECQHVPFFSYVPQYSQMNRAQLEWYLWWRECFRAGEVPTTDYSYVLLYTYELINLAPRMGAEAARDALCRVWLAYREVFRQLDGQIPEWLCDLCLVYRLPPPVFLSGAGLYAAMSRCALKEFYITASGEEGFLRALPVFCSAYDFHKSKFCTGANKPLFEKMIYGALGEVLEKTGKDGGFLDFGAMDTSRMVRMSYQGALCAESNKRKIAVEYTSFSCTHELRYRVTDIIKYAENRIRAHIGVRSRLSVYALGNSVRAIIDAYLDRHLPGKAVSATAKREEPAAYEKLYELPRTQLSLSRAAEIERASWDTTEQLIEAFEEAEDEKTPVVQAPPPPPVSAEEDAAEDLYRALKPYAAFIKAALEGNAHAQRGAAKAMGKMLDAVADAINEIATEHTGDILLEDTGAGYAVIDDYCELARTLTE